jgi:ankyrin repeat protein
MEEELDKIIEGAVYGDVNLIEEALKEGIDPDFKYRGHSALQWAVQESHKDAISMLLEGGADIENRDDDNGFSILDTAVGECSNLEEFELKIEVVKLLIKKGVNINGETANGSVLHTACAYGLIEVVKLLLDNHIKANIKDSDSKLAIEYAKINEHKEIIKLIKTYHNKS